jgi:hypothetical protein
MNTTYAFGLGDPASWTSVRGGTAMSGHSDGDDTFHVRRLGAVVRLAGLGSFALLALMPGDGRAQTPSGSPAAHGTGICHTEAGWCPLPPPERTPSGVACYCVLPGPRYVYGVTRAERYQGAVSPYFNSHAENPPIPAPGR